MFKQKPPGEGGKSRPVQFSYTSTLPGQEWTAFLAGPIQWLECHCHEEHPTKPCLKWITSGALPCPRCGLRDWSREDCGHVPLYRESNHQDCLVVLKEVARDLADQLEVFDYVIVSKESGKKSPVTVRKHPRQKKWSSTRPVRNQPADVEFSLLTMWKINELTEWKRMQVDRTIVIPEPAAPDVTIPPGAHVLDVNRVGGIIEEQADDLKKKAEARKIVGKALSSWGKPSENGDGSHKPK